MGRKKVGRKVNQTFPVTAELTRLRELTVVSWLSGDYLAWAAVTRALKDELERVREELMTPERLEDLRVNRLRRGRSADEITAAQARQREGLRRWFAAKRAAKEAAE